MKYLLVAIFILNFIVFITYGIDKYKAKHHHYRISETTLILIALPFSSLGALLGMYLFHHKTKHLKFVILIPLSFVIHSILIFYIKSIFF